MDKSYSTTITLNGKPVLASIIPELRKDGMYYEVNIKGYPRFFMTWSPLGRYDITGTEKPGIPYDVVLTVSDAIEANK